MNPFAQQTTPEALREQINRVLSAFKHPTLQRDLTVLKTLHHVNTDRILIHPAKVKLTHPL